MKKRVKRPRDGKKRVHLTLNVTPRSIKKAQGKAKAMEPPTNISGFFEAAAKSDKTP